MAIKDRIKEARQRKNFTQEQLASQIGIAKSTLAGYETGIREPSIEIIGKIMYVLDIDANYLWQDEMDFPMQVSYTEMEHVKKYRSLDPHGQQTVDIILDRELKRSGQLRDAQDQLRQSQERITELESQAAVPDNIVPITEKPVPDHLAVQAAHNDSIIDDEELDKMQRDMEMLKKYRK